MSARRVAALAVAFFTVANPAHAQVRGPRGASVKVERIPQRARVPGELIAVSTDSVWVLGDSGLVAIPANEIRRVLVKRTPLGSEGFLAWGLIVGASTGVVLQLACEQDPDLQCGNVFVVNLLGWTGVGALWGAVAGSSHRSIGSGQIDVMLRRYARFPQGLPQPFEPQSLLP